MYYQEQRRECSEHLLVKERIEAIERDMVTIHSDLRMIKYLLITVIASILGTEVVI